MSLGKRQTEETAERESRNEKKACGCKWNMDDKFEILCEKHQAEADKELEMFQACARQWEL